MPTRDREAKITALKREVERQAREHAEKMRRRTPSADAAAREMDARRAETLARRLRELDELLASIRRGKSG